MFERLTWKDDRVLLDDLVFYLDQQESEPTERSPDGIFLCKPLRLLEQYRQIWRQKPEMPSANMLELGIFDGGSVVFWYELLRPDKYVALEIENGDRAGLLKDYIASRSLENRIKTFWNTDQNERENLRRIVANEFNGPLDLVIDDASHCYGPTRASFETLFPMLRPGGLFIIEDWSWGCWPNLSPDLPPAGTELPELVHQIVNVAGSMKRFLVGDRKKPNRMTLRPLIASVTTYPDLVAVERGDAAEADVSDFDLERYATSRPPGRPERLFTKIRHAWKANR